MKTIYRVPPRVIARWTLIFAFGFVVCGQSRTYAQTEIDPDHFESPDMEPFQQSPPQADVAAQVDSRTGQKQGTRGKRLIRRYVAGYRGLERGLTEYCWSIDPAEAAERKKLASSGRTLSCTPCAVGRHILMGDPMLNTKVAGPAAMESGGSYNRHARLPAGGATLALPFLEQAVKNLFLDGKNGSSHPVVVADYGSSQGKNSLAPMRAVIRGLRASLGANRAIAVVHVDQPANDFNTLFDVLHCDPERYSAEDPFVFPSAIGRSFYEQVFPEGYVDLGWSSYAAVWLSRVPAAIPGHFIMTASTGEVREAFDRQGAEDWRRFLSLRATELRPGGRLVVVLPAMNDQGVAGIEPLFNQANAAIAEMVAEGSLRAEERARMVLPVYARRRAQLLEPFGTAGKFQGLVVKHCDLAELPDAGWADYQLHGNLQAFAKHQAAFIRAVFAPSLAVALADPGKRNFFADELEIKLRQRVAEHPQPFHSFVQTMVLAKEIRGAASIT